MQKDCLPQCNSGQKLLMWFSLFILSSCGGGGGGGADTSAQPPAASNNPASPPTATPTPNPTPTPAPEPVPDPFPANNFVNVKTEFHLYVSPNGSDNNPGTKEAPFKTIARAAEAAVPDTTIHVAEGTYTGEFVTKKSGTESKRIYFVSDMKWGAKIVPPPAGKNGYAWFVTGNYVTISGFEIDGSNLSTSGPNWRIGILTSSSNVNLENNHIHHIAFRASDCTNAGGGAIVGDGFSKGSNVNMDRNLVHDIGPVGGQCNSIHGLYMGTSGTISNNIVYRVGYGGIHLWHDADHVDIFNNTVFNTPKAIIVGSGEKYNLFTPGDFINVANNILVDNGYGIIEESDGTGNGWHNTYTNNLFFRNKVNLAINVQNVINISGSIFGDPMFVNYDINGNGDYRLKDNSPAIDKGTPKFAAKIDFHGLARPRGTSNDIGALEF